MKAQSILTIALLGLMMALVSAKDDSRFLRSMERRRLDGGRCWTWCRNGKSSGGWWGWAVTCSCYDGWTGKCCNEAVPEPDDWVCPYRKYDAKLVLPANAEKAGVAPPMKVATDANVAGLDFNGIWWMSDNPVAEELVSFAGTVLKDGNENFPVTLEVPNGASGMWAWNTGLQGEALMRYYTIGDPDPLEPTDFVFESTEKGQISTGLTAVPLVWVDAFPFYKFWENKPDAKEYPNDTWLRPTIFQEKSLFPDTNYTLKRVIMPDGTGHPKYWPEFLKHMESKGGELISYTSDNACERACWATVKVIPFKTCQDCKEECRGKKL